MKNAEFSKITREMKNPYSELPNFDWIQRRHKF